MRLAVKGWERFQHYKHRKPPWIRLYRTLLEDVNWHMLPVASRALAPMLWLLASESKNGVIDGEPFAIAFRVRLASADFEEALSPLIAGGWFIKIEPESILLASRPQDAPSEFRDQSTESLTSNLTDPARDAAPERSRSAPRAKGPSVKERTANLAALHRSKTMGQA